MCVHIGNRTPPLEKRWKLKSLQNLTGGGKELTGIPYFPQCFKFWKKECFPEFLSIIEVQIMYPTFIC